MTTAELAAIVREHTDQAVAKALAPVLAENKALELRILDLETRPPVVGPHGAKGDTGLMGVGIASLVVSAEGKLLAHTTDGRTLDAGPVPRGLPGEPGAAGAKGDPGAAGPAGEKGTDGLRGEKGADADPSLVLALKSELELVRASLHTEPVPGPAGPPGRDGIDGVGIQGPPGKDGAPGLHGKDAADLLETVIDRHGHLIVTFSDGRTKDVGPVVGHDGAPGLHGKSVELHELTAQIQAAVDAIPRPKDGRDGVDGMTIEDVDLTFDEKAGWELRVSAAGRTKAFPLPLPFDVGPWTAGETYPAGAGVSWDGGYWIAKALTHEQPGSGADWRLCVRRGKQGKEGPRGKDGQDLRPGNTPPLYG